MKITKDNITDLQFGQKVFIAASFKCPQQLIYMGFIDKMAVLSDGTFSQHVYLNNPHHNIDLRDGNLFTTYEECCARMRELSILTIDHFNSHQFKDNPIKYEKISK